MNIKITVNKAFTLIEILITISIISLAMVGISTLTGSQVDRMREKIIREDFINSYNAILLNSIGSSNVDNQWTKNTFTIYDGVVSWAVKSHSSSDYLVYKNGLPWNATIIFDNYGLWCSVDSQTWLQMIEGIQLKTIANEKPTIGCFMIDLGTCKLLEKKCNTD